MLRMLPWYLVKSSSEIPHLEAKVPQLSLETTLIVEQSARLSKAA